MSIEELDEAALFNEAVSDEPASPPEPEVEVEVEPKEPEPEVVAETTEKPVVDDNAPQVPSWRVREINEEKRVLADKLTAYEAEKSAWQREQQELRQRLGALEKPEQPKAAEEPDPLLDPKGYRDHMEKRFEERLASERREIDLRLTRQSDPDTFDKAYQEASKVIQSGDRSLIQQMNASASPGKTLLDWYRQTSTLKEVGTDPAAYKQRLREEALKDPEFRKAAMEAWRAEAQPQSNGRPRVDLPPSLNGASRSNAMLKSASNEDDVDDRELFAQITG